MHSAPASLHIAAHAKTVLRQPDANTVAVVDVVNAGRVHLADGLDAGQRVYVAAVAASLLLLDPELGE